MTENHSDNQATDYVSVLSPDRRQNEYLKLIRERETVYAHNGLKAEEFMQKCRDESEALLPSLACTLKRQSCSEKFVPSKIRPELLSKSKLRIDLQTGLMTFPSADRWLNGEEYAFLIRHYRAYSLAYPDQMAVADLQHPDAVYDQPKSKSNFADL